MIAAARDVGDGRAFGEQRIGEQPPFKRLVAGVSGVKLKVSLAIFTDNEPSLVFTDFDNVRLSHDTSCAGWRLHPFNIGLVNFAICLRTDSAA